MSRALRTLGVALALAVAPLSLAETVSFADPNLEAVVRETFEELGRPLGETIGDLDLVGVGFTRLTASRRCISSLEGLQFCTDLNYLDLSYNAISDISPLASLTRLECLFLGIYDFEATPRQALPEPAIEYFRNNLITDISPLAGLHNLNYVDLAGNNQLENADVLAQLPRLEWLVLGKNKISDYRFLGSMPLLANFSNFYGGMTDTDLALLGNNRGMLRLGIGFNRITSLAPLANFPDIYALLAQGNEIADLSPLEKLPRLEYIFLQSNKITSLGPLARNPGVGYRDFFNLGNNPISLESACEDLPVIRARFDRHGKFGCAVECGEARALTIKVQGTGTTLPPPGTRSYKAGAHLSVVACPLAGSGAAFEGWAGVNDGSEDPSITLDMNQPRELQAFFVPRGDHSLTVNVTGNGRGAVLPGTGGPFSYLHDRVALLSATPIDGQFFTGWTGDITSPEPTIALRMDRDKTVTAHFTIFPQTLTMAEAEGGFTTPPPGSLVVGRGTAIQIRARPAPGFEFAGWKGNLDPALAGSAAARLVLDYDLTLTPRFVKR